MIVGAHDVGVALTVGIIAKDDVEVTIPLAQAEQVAASLAESIAIVRSRK